MSCDITSSIQDAQTLTLGRNTDPLITINVKLGNGRQNLTGKKLDLIVKASGTTLDSSADFTLSSTGGSPKINVTNASNGVATADFTGVLTPSLSTPRFYKIVMTDIATGRRSIVAYGPFVLVDL